MKILHLVPYIPTPPNFGGALRIYHILNHLHDNHEVTVAGFGTTGDMDQFVETFPELKHKTHLLSRPWRNRFRRFIQFYSLLTDHSFWYNQVSSNTLQDRVNRLISRHDFDLIQAEFPTMARFIPDCDAVKVLDAHNVEYDNFRRMARMASSDLKQLFYQREYEKFYEEEIEICNRQDAIFTTSGRDKEMLDNDTPGIPKYVIPNGVDMSYFRPSDQKPEPYSLVFTGMMGYVPNYEGMVFFLDEILPLIREVIPEIKVYIVGKNPPDAFQKREDENVVVTGFVEDVRPFVWRSSVFIVPLNMGGGTRLKVLEALAMKKPVVTTGIGCEGIDVEDGVSAMIDDNPQAFANSVIRLLREQALREKVCENGYELVREKYRWEVIGSKIEEAFESIFYNSSDKVPEIAEMV